MNVTSAPLSGHDDPVFCNRNLTIDDANGSAACTRLRNPPAQRSFDLISDALPFGRLWYADPNAASNAVDYAKHRSKAREDEPDQDDTPPRH